MVPYPPRPHLQTLPQFTGTNRPGTYADPVLIAFVIEQYTAGRSLREIAELTGRTHSAVRNILDRAGLARRSRGADRVPGARRRR